MSGGRRSRVAVVGGGPAGSTCASRLAAGGIPVDLFEARPSGEKPCGGGVPGAALDEFPELAEPRLARRIVREIVLHAPSGRTATIPLDAGIHVFRRRELDSHLREQAERAGATLRTVQVSGIARNGDGRWELSTDSGCFGPYDFLVGADGVRGIVRRAVASRPAPENLSLALYAYVPGVPREQMILKFFAGSDGYLWVFPRVDHLSIGICATRAAATAERLEEDLRRFMEAHYPEATRAEPHLRGYWIPSDPAPPSGTAGDRWALIGDAAGFVDPVTREGIAPAMRSAAVLARALLAAREHSLGETPVILPEGQVFVARPGPTNGNGTAAHPHTPPLPENLRLGHLYKRGFFKEEFVEKMVWMASESRAIRHVLSDLFDGKQGYEGLKRRLVINALRCGLEIGLRSLFGKSRSDHRPAA